MNDFAPPPAESPSKETAPERAPKIPKLEDFPEAGPNALGSFGQRALARTMDALVFFYVPVLVGSLAVVVAASGRGVLDLIDPATPTPSEDVIKKLGEAQMWIVAVGVLVSVVYEVACVALRGKTLGDWVCGLRIARYADGKKPNLEQSALRCLLPTAAGVATVWITGTVLAGAMVVYLSAFFNPLRRGWHDIAGGTVVVRTR